MAMTLAAPETDAARRAGSGLVLAGDRTVEARRAKRGSRRVRVLRIALPIASIFMIGVYVVEVLNTAGLGSSLPELALRRLVPDDLAMKNPRYEGYGKDGSSYVFMAQKAKQDLSTPSIVKLQTISGTVLQANRQRTEISAASGTFDHNQNTLDLFEDIRVASESGLKVRLTRATILTKENILTSPEPVAVEFPTGAIKAGAMTLRQKAREITFTDGVTASLTPPAKPQQSEWAPTTAAPASGNLFNAGAGPLVINAKRLDVSDMTRTATFAGDVTAAQGELSITTPELEVTYEGKSMLGDAGEGEKRPAAAQNTPTTQNAPDAPPSGAADAAEAAAAPPVKTAVPLPAVTPAPATEAAAPAAKLRRILAKEPVVLTRGATERLTSETAEFDAVNETASLFGNVVMQSGPTRRATSDRVDLDQRANTALLVGNVIVAQGENELRGRRLMIDRGAGRAQLTSPAGLGSGPSRIWARLTRGAKGPAAKAAPSPLASDTTGLGLATFKTDPNAPINIEADQLDVNDPAKQAAFKGDVKTSQGDFLLKSAELTAYYKGESGLAMASEDAGAKPAQPTELTRIEAKRNVTISSSQGQTATGDWAEFNAKTNIVTMGGNVILAQGQNMVRGTRLTIDMTTGESKIDTAASAAAAQASPGEKPAAGGRASAVFFPQQIQEASEKMRAGKAPATGAPVDGWSQSTSPAGRGGKLMRRAPNAYSPASPGVTAS